MGRVPLPALGCREGVASADAARLPHPLPQVCLKYYEYEFMELACQCPAVVCCRCAPTQKAQIVRLLQERTGKLTCAVGKLASVEGGISGSGQTCWRPCPAGPVCLRSALQML